MKVEIGRTMHEYEDVMAHPWRQRQKSYNLWSTRTSRVPRTWERDDCYSEKDKERRNGSEGGNVVG